MRHRETTFEEREHWREEFQSESRDLTDSEFDAIEYWEGFDRQLREQLRWTAFQNKIDAWGAFIVAAAVTVYYLFN